MSQTKSKGWPELGMIVKNAVNKRDENGNLLKDDAGNYIPLKDDAGNTIYNLSFKLSENVTVLVDGQPVQLNKGRSGKMVTPQQEVEGLYKAGAINEEKIEYRREKAKEVNNWLRYKIQLPPPRD